MDDGPIGKSVMRVGLALMALGIGVGIYKLTHRASPYAVPEPLLIEFRELAAVATGRSVTDSRELTQQQLDAMLYGSVGNASPQMVAWLLQRGANPRVNQKVNGASYADRSALQLAASRGRCEQEKLLIRRVGELASASASGSKEQRAAAGAAEVALFVDERDPEQRTALHHAVLGGDRACVAALLDAGARPDPLDARGATPLQLAEEKSGHLVPILQAALAKQRSADERTRATTPSARVPNAAQPTSSLPGAIAQAEAQAREWGPGGGPSVVIPTESSMIKLFPPKGTTALRSRSTAPAAPPATDLVDFAAPAVDTMTPCGNAMAQTSLRYRPRMEIEFRRNFFTWECRYVPTGSSAESKVEIDCDKRALAAWSTIFFGHGRRINETRWGEEMHAPKPATIEATLLKLACALPQPTAVELGRESPRPESIEPALDACFASAAKGLPAAPRGEIDASARDEITRALMQRCPDLSLAWIYACGMAGSTRDACTTGISQRAVGAYRKPRS